MYAYTYIFNIYIFILNAVAHNVERCYISNFKKLSNAISQITKSCKNYRILFQHVLYL